MGFSKPDSGKVEIFGEPTFQKYYDVLKRVGYIPGEIALPAGLTGNEFLKMMQDLTGVKNEERINMLSDLFELDSASPLCDVKRMSLGVKRKLAVVSAFMSDPEVLILDEPTSGLDPVMQERFIQFIHKEKERGKTILLSSHIFHQEKHRRVYSGGIPCGVASRNVFAHHGNRLRVPCHRRNGSRTRLRRTGIA